MFVIVCAVNCFHQMQTTEYQWWGMPLLCLLDLGIPWQIFLGSLFKFLNFMSYHEIKSFYIQLKLNFLRM
jgi:hypothetical protein